jgi:TPR repeat protein
MKRSLLAKLVFIASLVASAQSPNLASFQRNLNWAETGNVSAEVIVGRDYLRGNVVPENYQAARSWFDQASRAGSLDATAWLASMNIRGQGSSKDVKVGLDSLQAAVAAGNPKAKLFMAQIYESGKIVPKDLDKAVQLYRESADEGDSDAMAGLGNLYLRGIGVSLDQKTGMRLLGKSAALGNEWGEVFLAHVLIASSSDDAERESGLNLLRASAAQKNPEALFEMGSLSEQGLLVTKDSRAAADYYLRAAKLDFVPAQREIATAYALGLGVSKADRKAYYWAAVAAYHGDAKGARLADTLKPKLSQADLTDLEQRLIAFESLHHAR